MTAFLITMLYTVITLVLGIIVGRRNKNLQQFFVAKEQLGFVLCCVLLMASTFAGAYTSGTVSDSYLAGFMPYIPVASMALGYTLFIPLVRFYRGVAREGHISIPEAFAIRFDGKVKAAILIINSFAYGAVFAVQPVAFANIIAPMLGVNPEIVAWCAAALMTIMALTGLTGVAWMNIIHCLAMVGGLSVVSIISIHAAGGISHIAAVVPAQTWNLFQPNVATVIVRCISLTACMFAASEAATIAIAAKNKRAAFRSLATVSVFIALFTFLLVMIGISGRVLVPGLEKSSTALYSIAVSISPAISVVASIAVIAAIMSSAPAYMIYFSTGITRDVIARIAPNASEKRMKLYSKICILALALIGTFMAMRASSILGFLFNVFEVQSIGGLVLIIAFYWKRVSAKSAFWSIIVGSVSAAIWMVLGNPFGIVPSWIVMGFGVSTLIIMTMLEKAKVSSGYTQMRGILDKYPD